MNIVHIFVTLKIPDNTARSALYTLQNRMGCTSLHSLRRSEFWRLAFPSLSEQDAQNTVTTLVEKTAYFANPNKHRWVIETVTEIDDQAKIQSPFDADASILVCDKIDGKAEATLQALQEVFDTTQHPYSLQRGWWWDLQFENSQSSQISEMVESLAVSKSRKEGFFANPHYQTAEIFYPHE